MRDKLNRGGIIDEKIEDVEMEVGEVIIPIKMLGQWGDKVDKYRKKPVVVEAIQVKWGMSAKDIVDFVGVENYGRTIDNVPVIRTLEGDMKFGVSDYIIKGVQGEFYPCKPDIFEATYEKVE